MIIIPGEPVAKGRPRMTRSGIAFTPEKTRRWEDHARVCALEQWRSPRLTGAVQLVVAAYFTMPRSWPKWKQEIALVWNTSRPDWDNIGKAASDALQGVCFVDDAQVCRCMVETMYGDPPRVEVEVIDMRGAVHSKSKRAVKFEEPADKG